MPAPPPKPLMEMSITEQRDYWRWYARRHEYALKALLNDLDTGVPVKVAITRASRRRAQLSQEDA